MVTTYNFEKNLSDEVLVLVLGYLTPKELGTEVPLVCRRWRELCYDDDVWNTLDLYKHREIKEAQLRHIVMQHRNIKKLILRDRADLTDRCLVWCVFHLNNLRNLDLSFCPQVGPKIISAIAQFCGKIRNLNVNGCPGFDNECLLILTGCAELRHINFSECDTVTDFGFHAMSSYFTKLHSVKCDGVISLHDEAIEGIVLTKCDSLTDLQLDGGNLTDEGVQMLSELLYLRRLTIQYCDELTDDAISGFSQLRYLEELTLTRAHSFTSIGIQKVMQRPHHFIRRVQITECSGLDDDAMSALGRSCPNITSLDVSWCRRITDNGIINFMDRTPQLTHLNLRSVPLAEDFVAFIPTFCPLLKYLNVISCSLVREEDLRNLSALMADIEIAYNRDLGCSPKSIQMLRYFDIMSPRDFRYN